MIFPTILLITFFSISDGSLSCANITGPLVVADNKVIDVQAQQEFDYDVPAGSDLGYVWQTKNFVIEGMEKKPKKFLIIRNINDQTEVETPFRWEKYDFFFQLGDTVEDLYLHIGYERVPPVGFGLIHKFNSTTSMFIPTEMEGWDESIESLRGTASLASINGSHCLIGGVTPTATGSHTRSNKATLCFNMQTRKWEDQGTRFDHHAARSVVYRNQLYVCFHEHGKCFLHNLTSGDHIATFTSNRYVTHSYRMYTAKNEVHVVGWDMDLATVSDCTIYLTYPRCTSFKLRKKFQGLLQPCNIFDGRLASKVVEPEASVEATTQAKASTNNSSGMGAWIGLMSGWTVVVFIAMLIVFAAYLMDRKKATCEKCGNEMQAKK